MTLNCYVLDSGAKVDGVDSEGCTALHLATEEGQEMCTRVCTCVPAYFNCFNSTEIPDNSHEYDYMLWINPSVYIYNIYRPCCVLHLK